MTKKMTEKGWLVEEEKPRTGGPAQNVSPVFDFAKECAARQVVAVPVDEYTTMTERLAELERTMDEIAKDAIAAGKDSPIVPEEKKVGKGKAKLNVEEIKTGIAAATSLDDLTELMSRVDDPALLALADAKAAELS